MRALITSARVLPVVLAALGAFGFFGSRLPLRFFFATSEFLTANAGPRVTPWAARARSQARETDTIDENGSWAMARYTRDRTLSVPGPAGAITPTPDQG